MLCDYLVMQEATGEIVAQAGLASDEAAFRWAREEASARGTDVVLLKDLGLVEAETGDG